MDQGASGTNQGGGFNDIVLDGVVCVVMCIHCFTTVEKNNLLVYSDWKVLNGKFDF
jgi:hypothetical protein